MRIGIVSETSTALKNLAIVEALSLSCPDHSIYNLGMKGISNEPELLIYETGFLTALLLNLRCVDFVIGGCGTGQGYFNCAVQFPGVICGLILDPSDAWLYPRINNGNCVSLALNKGYGWGGEVNLQFMFEKLFSAEFGAGYPTSRKEAQKKIYTKLVQLSQTTHKDFEEIIRTSDEEIFRNVVNFPGVMDFIQSNTIEKDKNIYKVFCERAIAKKRI